MTEQQTANAWRKIVTEVLNAVTIDGTPERQRLQDIYAMACREPALGWDCPEQRGLQALAMATGRRIRVSHAGARFTPVAWSFEPDAVAAQLPATASADAGATATASDGQPACLGQDGAAMPASNVGATP